MFWRSWQELSKQELYDLLQLRLAVFSVEQDCPYLDADDYDQNARHMVGTVDGELVAYARILDPDATFQGFSSIGRIITKESQRGKGYGKIIIDESITLCKRLFPEHDIKIGAQTYLLDYYQSFGFQPVGEKYLEDGIEHQKMVLVS